MPTVQRSPAPDASHSRDSSSPVDGVSRWQLALEGANEAVWDWNFTTGVIYHDEKWARMLGYESAEIDASFDGWRQLVHPDDYAACEQVKNDHFAQRLPLYQAEYRMRTKSGTWHWILDRGKVVERGPDGQPLRMVGTHADITTRKDLEHRLRRSDELADQVSRLARIGGWEVDLHTKRVTWSREVHRIHEAAEGYQPTLDDVRWLFPPGYLESIEQDDPNGRVDMFDRELPLVTAKGRHIWVRVLGRTEIQEGRPGRVHGALQDITAQHQSETDRRQLELQLFQAQKMETLGTLSGGIAHDFNNLLTGILGFHELASDSIPADHPARACLAEAQHASLRARELVEQILTFSRQSAKTEHGAIDPGLVVEEARRFLRATLPSNINIETAVDPACPNVLADATQIHQVMLNLGSNAAHAMRRHGGTLRISLQPWEIEADQSVRLGDVHPGRYVRLSLSDTGHGMDEKTQRRIFEPFFTTKNTKEGTGLGLAICKRLVELMGGRIWVESVPGNGSTFAFELTVEPAALAEPMPTGDDTSLSIDNRRVLIVDDNATNRRILCLQLGSWGLLPTSVASGAEALARLARGENYDVAILDLQMPGMDGHQLAAQMRRQRTPVQLPLIMLTSLGHATAPAELNIVASVSKPVKPSTLFDLLVGIFHGRKVSRTASVDPGSAGEPLGQSHPLTILIAEDNAVNQRVAKLMLQRLGYEADFAANGREAVNAVANKTYDLVLMDMQMPELDGPGAAREICASLPASARPRIVAMTASASSADRDTCLAAGMDEFVTKPVRLQDLRRTLLSTPAGSQVAALPSA